MGQYFQVNGDYNIKTKGGSTITFDTGADENGTPGNVNVVGNLTVAGDLVAVTSTNIEINDRVLILNKGEPTSSNGVTNQYSGIEIHRGAAESAAFVWNDDPTSTFGGYWMAASGSSDGLPWVAADYGLANSNIKVRRILTDAGTDSGDLTLIGTGTGVVKVAGTTNYRLQVTDNDDIPNKDYVDYSILNNPTFQIRAPQGQDTRIIITDKEITPNNATTGGSIKYFKAQTGYNSGPSLVAGDGGTESSVSFLVDGTLISQLFSNRVYIQDLEFRGSEITHDASNENIFINTNGTGRLQTNYGIQLDNNVVSPGRQPDSHVIYSRPQSTGKSGLFFVNTENNRDELVSKNRALLFSMLF